MRKLLWVFVCLFVLAGRIPVAALPNTFTAVWDANPPDNNVANYSLWLDGAVVGTPTDTMQVFTVTTVGTHRVHVTATNTTGGVSPPSNIIWITCTDTACTILPVGTPAPPTGLRVS